MNLKPDQKLQIALLLLLLGLSIPNMLKELPSFLLIWGLIGLGVGAVFLFKHLTRSPPDK